MPLTMTAPAELSVLDSVPRPKKSDAVRVDVVAVDEPHHGRGRHRIDALRGAAHPEAVADDGAGLVPDVVGPATPRLEVYAVGRHVDGKAADSHFSVIELPGSALCGAVAWAPPSHSARDYMTNRWQSRWHERPESLRGSSRAARCGIRLLECAPSDKAARMKLWIRGDSIRLRGLEDGARQDRRDGQGEDTVRFSSDQSLRYGIEVRRDGGRDRDASPADAILVTLPKTRWTCGCGPTRSPSRAASLSVGGKVLQIVLEKDDAAPAGAATTTERGLGRAQTAGILPR